jgi:HRDC domain
VGGGQWELKHVFVFRKLFLWREKEAERRDESPSYICRGSLLLDAAEFLPVTVSALMKLQSPLPASMRPSGACKSELAQGAKAGEGGEEGGGESEVITTETGTEGGAGVATTTATETVATTGDLTEKGIAIKVASEDSNDSHLNTCDTEEPIGSKDDVVDLVAAVKAALRSWDAVMRKQNNSPATDRPDDSSPESYREKHVKRSTYHNKNNSQNLEGKNIDAMSSNANEKVDVTVTENEKVKVKENVSADGKDDGVSTACTRTPGSGVILVDSTIIAENSIKRTGVTSTSGAESSVTNTSNSSSSSSSNSSSIVKRSVTSGTSITLLCAATILSVGAFIFLRRKA